MHQAPARSKQECLLTWAIPCLPMAASSMKDSSVCVQGEHMSSSSMYQQHVSYLAHAVEVVLRIDSLAAMARLQT